MRPVPVREAPIREAKSEKILPMRPYSASLALKVLFDDPDGTNFQKLGDFQKAIYDWNEGCYFFGSSFIMREELRDHAEILSFLRNFLSTSKKKTSPEYSEETIGVVFWAVTHFIEQDFAFFPRLSASLLKRVSPERRQKIRSQNQAMMNANPDRKEIVQLYKETLNSISKSKPMILLASPGFDKMANVLLEFGLISSMELIKMIKSIMSKTDKAVCRDSKTTIDMGVQAAILFYDEELLRPPINRRKTGKGLKYELTQNIFDLFMFIQSQINDPKGIPKTLVEDFLPIFIEGRTDPIETSIIYSRNKINSEAAAASSESGKNSEVFKKNQEKQYLDSVSIGDSPVVKPSNGSLNEVIELFKSLQEAISQEYDFKDGKTTESSLERIKELIFSLETMKVTQFGNSLALSSFFFGLLDSLKYILNSEDLEKVYLLLEKAIAQDEFAAFSILTKINKDLFKRYTKTPQISFFLRLVNSISSTIGWASVLDESDMVAHLIHLCGALINSESQETSFQGIRFGKMLLTLLNQKEAKNHPYFEYYCSLVWQSFSHGFQAIQEKFLKHCGQVSQVYSSDLEEALVKKELFDKLPAEQQKLCQDLVVIGLLSISETIGSEEVPKDSKLDESIMKPKFLKLFRDHLRLLSKMLGTPKGKEEVTRIFTNNIDGLCAFLGELQKFAQENQKDPRVIRTVTQDILVVLIKELKLVYIYEKHLERLKDICEKVQRVFKAFVILTEPQQPPNPNLVAKYRPLHLPSKLRFPSDQLDIAEINDQKLLAERLTITYTIEVLESIAMRITNNEVYERIYAPIRKRFRKLAKFLSPSVGMSLQEMYDADSIRSLVKKEADPLLEQYIEKKSKISARFLGRIFTEKKEKILLKMLIDAACSFSLQNKTSSLGRKAYFSAIHFLTKAIDFRPSAMAPSAVEIFGFEYAEELLRRVAAEVCFSVQSDLLSEKRSYLMGFVSNRKEEFEKSVSFLKTLVECDNQFIKKFKELFPEGLSFSEIKLVQGRQVVNKMNKKPGGSHLDNIFEHFFTSYHDFEQRNMGMFFQKDNEKIEVHESSSSFSIFISFMTLLAKNYSANSPVSLEIRQNHYKVGFDLMMHLILDIPDGKFELSFPNWVRLFKHMELVSSYFQDSIEKAPDFKLEKMLQQLARLFQAFYWAYFKPSKMRKFSYLFNKKNAQMDKELISVKDFLVVYELEEVKGHPLFLAGCRFYQIICQMGNAGNSIKSSLVKIEEEYSAIRFHLKTTNDQVFEENLVMCIGFLRKMYRTLEVIDVGGSDSITKVFYERNPKFNYISQSSVDDLMDEIELEDRSLKFLQLFDHIRVFEIEMNWYSQKQLNRASFLWIFSPFCFHYLKWFNFTMALLVNIVILGSYHWQEVHESPEFTPHHDWIYHALQAVVIFLILLNFIYLLGWFFIAWRPIYGKQEIYFRKTHAKYTKGPIPFRRRLIGIFLWRSIIRQSEFQSMFLLIVTGIVYLSAEMPFFYAINLGLILSISSAAGFVVQSITNKGKFLLATLLLAIFLNYGFALIYAQFYRSHFFSNDVMGEKGELYAYSDFCEDLYECTIYTSVQGMLTGSGAGGVMKLKGFNEQAGNYTLRNFVDIMNFILLDVLILNIVAGIVIDSFAELRDNATQRGTFPPFSFLAHPRRQHPQVPMLRLRNEKGRFGKSGHRFQNAQQNHSQPDEVRGVLHAAA